ncbi:hypothetical protein [Actinokineospora sp. NBRC 105648]|uniref:hypothetical protein n=1 Tax=Actinokineospora sp. NBRC 105648 TaxID=3032206 RepID=UPI00249FEF75|nr:hypothetical protein [Actinokineospora sp. NBRC 105648]GLZ37961.1 hypothetical protein Acsp05_15850 [Actinokineospora sp. NBRC 105648]
MRIDSGRESAESPAVEATDGPEARRGAESTERTGTRDSVPAEELVDTEAVERRGLLDDEVARASAAELDPADKGGQLERGGRALHKHASRDSNTGQWPLPEGKRTPEAWNELGRVEVDKILKDDGRTEEVRRGRIGGEWRPTIEVRDSTGRGIRTDESSGFVTLLDEKEEYDQH